MREKERQRQRETKRKRDRQREREGEREGLIYQRDRGAKLKELPTARAGTT